MIGGTSVDDETQVGVGGLGELFMDQIRAGTRRAGWRVMVWCYVIVDDAEPDMLLFNPGVQIYSTRRAVQPGPVPARIRRALRRQFEPLGFREVRVTLPQTSFGTFQLVPSTGPRRFLGSEK